MVKPGYKQTEIGIIPVDWDVVSLNSLAVGGMQNGVFYEVDRKGSGVSFLNVGDLYGETPIRSSSLQKFNATLSEIDRFRINSGDLFFTRSSIVPSGIAYCNWYYGLDEEITVFDSHVVRFKTDLSKVVPMYLYLQCITPSSRKYFIANSKTATMTTIDQAVLGECQIALPSMKEQEIIAQTISDIDCLITNLEKLLAKKKAIKQGAMQELLTGKRRLPGFDGEWVEVTMDSYVDFQVGFPFSSAYFNNGSDGLRLIKNRDLKSDEQIYYTSESYASEYVVENGDILVGMDGDFLPCRWHKGKALLNQRVGRLLPKKNLDGLFAYYALQKPLAELQNGTGATTVKHLSHGDIKKLVIPMPPTKKEQTAIAEILSDMDSELEEFNQILVKYRLIRQGMMSELLTGRIRLVEQL